jgi:hypothetical protein
MSPAADDVITADWGQKLAANTAYLQTIKGPPPKIDIGFCTVTSLGNANAAAAQGTVWFRKPPAGTLCGTVNFNKYWNDTTALNCDIYVDGTKATPVNQGTLSTATSAIETTTYGFTFPITHLTNDQMYAFAMKIKTVTGDYSASGHCNTYFVA